MSVIVMCKKFLLLLLCVAIILVGCTLNPVLKEEIDAEKTSDTSSMVIDSNSIKASIIVTGEEFYITYTNTTKIPATHGTQFELQRLEGNVWVEIPLLPNIAFYHVLYHLRGGESYQERIRIADMYGYLEKGHYRVKKEFEMEDVSVIVFAEFDYP